MFSDEKLRAKNDELRLLGLGTKQICLLPINAKKLPPEIHDDCLSVLYLTCLSPKTGTPLLYVTIFFTIRFTYFFSGFLIPVNLL